MMVLLIPLVFLLGVAVIVLLTAVKRVDVTTRLAVLRLGLYTGLVGPGLVILVPIIDRAIRLRVGQAGTLQADGTANFDGLFIPVRVEAFSVPVGARVEIAGFEGSDNQSRAIVRRSG